MLLTKSYNSYKKSPYRSIKHSTYFEVYDELFKPYIGKPITFVEIGVLGGGSLFMWRDFFGPQARIIGIDLNPDAKRWEKQGFEIYIGSQKDPQFWKEFSAAVGMVDIVLDDGGHTYEQQIVTAECLKPLIKDGGLLIVEDCHTSYMNTYGIKKISFINYCKNIINGLNFRFSKFKRKKSENVIWSIQFFESFVAFNINRNKCSVQSVQTDNGGKKIDFDDFRYDDIKILPVPENHTGIIKLLAKQTRRSILFAVHLFRANRLRRFFKY